jgi:hypothetical protein
LAIKLVRWAIHILSINQSYRKSKQLKKSIGSANAHLVGQKLVMAELTETKNHDHVPQPERAEVLKIKESIK